MAQIKLQKPSIPDFSAANQLLYSQQQANKEMAKTVDGLLDSFSEDIKRINTERVYAALRGATPENYAEKKAEAIAAQNAAGSDLDFEGLNKYTQALGPNMMQIAASQARNEAQAAQTQVAELKNQGAQAIYNDRGKMIELGQHLITRRNLTNKATNIPLTVDEQKQLDAANAGITNVISQLEGDQSETLSKLFNNDFDAIKQRDQNALTKVQQDNQILQWGYNNQEALQRAQEEQRRKEEQAKKDAEDAAKKAAEEKKALYGDLGIPGVNHDGVILPPGLLEGITKSTGMSSLKVGFDTNNIIGGSTGYDIRKYFGISDIAEKPVAELFALKKKPGFPASRGDAKLTYTAYNLTQEDIIKAFDILQIDPKQGRLTPQMTNLVIKALHVTDPKRFNVNLGENSKIDPLLIPDIIKGMRKQASDLVGHQYKVTLEDSIKKLENQVAQEKRTMNLHVSTKTTMMYGTMDEMVGSIYRNPAFLQRATEDSRAYTSLDRDGALVADNKIIQHATGDVGNKAMKFWAKNSADTALTLQKILNVQMSTKAGYSEEERKVMFLTMMDHLSLSDPIARTESAINNTVATTLKRYNRVRQYENQIQTTKAKLLQNPGTN